MKVQMGHRLPRRKAVVDPHVVAVRVPGGLDLFPDQGDGVMKLSLLLRGSVEPTPHMPPGNDESMTVAHRICVPKSKDVGSFEEHPVGIGSAERTGPGGHVRLFIT